MEGFLDGTSTILVPKEEIVWVLVEGKKNWSIRHFLVEIAESPKDLLKVCAVSTIFCRRVESVLRTEEEEGIDREVSVGTPSVRFGNMEIGRETRGVPPILVAPV